MKGDAAVSPLPVTLSEKGQQPNPRTVSACWVTQPEGQYLLYLLVVSFWISSISKSRVPLALALEHFPGGEAFVRWDVAGRGREGLTQELEVARNLKGWRERDAGQACPGGNTIFLGTGRGPASNLPQFRKLPSWLKQRLEAATAAARTRWKGFLNLVFLLCCNRG